MNYRAIFWAKYKIVPSCDDRDMDKFLLLHIEVLCLSNFCWEGLNSLVSVQGRKPFWSTCWRILKCLTLWIGKLDSLVGWYLLILLSERILPVRKKCSWLFNGRKYQRPLRCPMGISNSTYPQSYLLLFFPLNQFFLFLIIVTTVYLIT